MPEPVAGVVVPEVRPVVVSRNRAWKILGGRFVVRFIEAFAGAVIGTTLFFPESAEGWQKLGAIIIAPLFTALYQAGRSAWPAIKKWLDSGGEEPPA